MRTSTYCVAVIRPTPTIPEASHIYRRYTLTHPRKQAKKNSCIPFYIHLVTIYVYEYVIAVLVSYINN